jgi:hypothetical protein
MGHPFFETAEVGATEIVPLRRRRIRRSIEEHGARENANKGQQEIRRHPGNIGKTMHDEGLRG